MGPEIALAPRTQGCLKTLHWLLTVAPLSLIACDL